MDEALETERANCYRRDLGHLSDTQWLWVCEQARKQEWFPSINDLLELAERAPIDDRKAQARLMGRVAPQHQSNMVTPPLELYEALVQENPKREGEHSMDYLVRIAEAAGVPKGGKRGEWPLKEREEVSK